MSLHYPYERLYNAARWGQQQGIVDALFFLNGRRVKDVQLVGTHTAVQIAAIHRHYSLLDYLITLLWNTEEDLLAVEKHVFKATCSKGDIKTAKHLQEKWRIPMKYRRMLTAVMKVTDKDRSGILSTVWKDPAIRGEVEVESIIQYILDVTFLEFHDDFSDEFRSSDMYMKHLTTIDPIIGTLICRQLDEFETIVGTDTLWLGEYEEGSGWVIGEVLYRVTVMGDIDVFDHVFKKARGLVNDGFEQISEKCCDIACLEGRMEIIRYLAKEYCSYSKQWVMRLIQSADIVTSFILEKFQSELSKDRQEIIRIFQTSIDAEKVSIILRFLLEKCEKSELEKIDIDVVLPLAFKSSPDSVQVWIDYFNALDDQRVFVKIRNQLINHCRSDGYSSILSNVAVIERVLIWYMDKTGDIVLSTGAKSSEYFPHILPKEPRNRIKVQDGSHCLDFIPSDISTKVCSLVRWNNPKEFYSILPYLAGCTLTWPDLNSYLARINFSLSHSARSILQVYDITLRDDIGTSGTTGPKPVPSLRASCRRVIRQTIRESNKLKRMSNKDKVLSLHTSLPHSLVFYLLYVEIGVYYLGQPRSQVPYPLYRDDYVDDVMFDFDSQESESDVETEVD